MTNAIAKTVFANNVDVRLRIWFSSDNSTFQALDPDRRIASAGYSLSSGTAGMVGANVVVSASVADNSLTANDLATDSVGTAEIINGTITSSDVSGSYQLMDRSSGTAYVSGGSSGLGSSDGLGQLSVGSHTGNHMAITYNAIGAYNNNAPIQTLVGWTGGGIEVGHPGFATAIRGSTTTFSGTGYFSGNVGIGDSTPSYNLDVAGTIRATNDVYVNDDLFVNSEVRVNSSAGASKILMYGEAGSSDRGQIYMYGTNGILNARIVSGGSVNSGYFGLYDDDGGEQLRMGVNSTDEAFLTVSGSNGNTNILLGFLSGYPSNGFLGVGDPGGSSRAGMYIRDDGAGVVFGDVNNISSDRRLKKNFESLSGALDKVRKINGVSYQRIGSPEEQREVGVIAQEIQAVLPDAVATMGASEPGDTSENPVDEIGRDLSGSEVKAVTLIDTPADVAPDAEALSGESPVEAGIGNDVGGGAESREADPGDASLTMAGSVPGGGGFAAGGAGMPQDTLYVNYNSITALLVEAMKELDTEVEGNAESAEEVAGQVGNLDESIKKQATGLEKIEKTLGSLTKVNQTLEDENADLKKRLKALEEMVKRLAEETAKQ